jgi:hypothetical protein
VLDAWARSLPQSLKRPLRRAHGRLLDSLAGSPLGRAVRPLLLRRYLSRPEELDIEVTSSCDADCIMCPRRGMTRAQGPMRLPLFQKIVDEAVDLGIPELVLNGYGEISTLRNHREYIGYIRQKSARIRITINTNGMRMDEAVATTFVDYAVDVVNVALDGATAATFEAIRKELKLDTVEANLHRLLAIRNARQRTRPIVMTHLIHMPQNAHETDLFLKKWTGVVDFAGIAGLYGRAGAVPLTIRGTKSGYVPCFLPWRQMPVLSDGTVALCCDDWDGQAAAGNLNTQTIREIWNSEARQALRQLHLDGRASEIPICAACLTPRRPPAWF